ncbi:MAG: aminotransferase class I/II-fold pyridoxal phosphate-dependent enzyme [Acidimicrobiia bacterium]|nr:aminotransferase class I/II-fold pyridoxal phosphate-dependent enzyme [Acidimicrobiia bacterium]
MGLGSLSGAPGATQRQADHLAGSGLGAPLFRLRPAPRPGGKSPKAGSRIRVNRLADRAVSLPRSEIRVLFDRAAARADTIRLEVGEPSFPTPAHIVAGAYEAARAGHTGYGPNGGLIELRELLSEKVEKVDGFVAHPERIVVTPGGMNALYSTYFALLNPGDEVLLPTPGFPNMDGMVGLLGGNPVFYHLEAAEGYLPDPERLERLVTGRTRILFLNTPSNPTGAVFPASLMRDLVEFCNRHNLWLLSDEVYDELVLDESKAHIAAGIYDEEDRVITVYSFSKVYAMTGWRVGYAVAPPAVADLLRKLQEPQVSCPSTISQKAAVAALRGPREPIRAMLDTYRRRRSAAIRTATSAGLEVVAPAGTLYMLVAVRTRGRSMFRFALDLLDSHGVSVAPGSVFGPGGEGYVRISLAAPEGQITEGLGRLAEACRQEELVHT